MYLIEPSVFMRLANGSHGSERIELRIIEVTAEQCFFNPAIASELREKIEAGAGRISDAREQVFAVTHTQTGNAALHAAGEAAHQAGGVASSG